MSYDKFAQSAEKRARIIEAHRAGHLATVAAGRLMGLTRDQMRAALGLCSTRAGGLRNQFGTMGKPYNAGMAASTGVEVAMLAHAGFTAPDDGIEGPKGFVDTHCDDADMAAGWLDPDRWLFEDVKYKLHACCHGLHAMIEGLGALGLRADQVSAVHLRTNPRWLTVCDIKQPRSGLEVKFSYGWLAAMVLSGVATGSDRSFTDAAACDPALAQVAARIHVQGDAALTDMQVAGQVVLQGGETRDFAYDLAAPTSMDRLRVALQAKAQELLGAKAAQRIWAAVDDPTVRANVLGEILRG